MNQFLNENIYLNIKIEDTILKVTSNRKKFNYK